MIKKTTFLDSPEWVHIVNNIKGLMTSDNVIELLLDFERVLDEADIYAFRNWAYGELVDGPIVKRYDVICTFMWPKKMMPDPRGAKRLLPLGCKVGYKKTKMKFPIEVKSPSDFRPGSNYPKMVDREVWLVNIVIPKILINDIKEGSIDVAGQTIDLEDLDDAYSKDYDTADVKSDKQQAQQNNASLMGMGPNLGV